MWGAVWLLLLLLLYSTGIRWGRWGCGWGLEGILVLIDTEERLETPHTFSSHEQEGGRSLEMRQSRGGWGSAAVAGCSVPSSVHVYREVMSESGSRARWGEDSESDSEAGDPRFQMMMLRKILPVVKRCQTYVSYEFVTMATMLRW